MRLSPRKVHDLDNLAEVERRRQVAEAEVTRWVQVCRQNGRSWAQIAEVFGITRQAAQQRFTPR